MRGDISMVVVVVVVASGDTISGMGARVVAWIFVARDGMSGMNRRIYSLRRKSRKLLKSLAPWVEVDIEQIEDGVCSKCEMQSPKRCVTVTRIV